MKNELFSSERLVFRAWENDDIEKANQLWGDIEVTQYIGGPFSIDKISSRLKQEIDNQEKYGIQYWPIYFKSNNEFVGCCGLRPYKDQHDTCEIGFHLCKKYWGLGLASEAVRKVLKYAFIDLGYKRIFAGHNPKNEKSMNTLLKLGFKYIGDEFYQPTGLNHPSYEMKISEYIRIGQ
jgi:RimJ/RimL family protein N-acetyltransferase